MLCEKFIPQESSQIHIAEDYHNFLRIVQMYPHLLRCTQKSVLKQICEIYESYINSNQSNQYEMASIYYDYVVCGLLPMFDITNDMVLLKKSIDFLLIAEQKSQDIELTRNIYVAKAKAYKYAGDDILAEKNILAAYYDYDYSCNTFVLLMQILDNQGKFEMMAKIADEYFNRYQNFHEKVCYEDLKLIKIQNTEYEKNIRKLLRD